LRPRQEGRGAACGLQPIIRSSGDSEVKCWHGVRLQQPQESADRVCTPAAGEVAIEYHESWAFENHDRDRVANRRRYLHVKTSLDEQPSYLSTNGWPFCDEEYPRAVPEAHGRMVLPKWSTR
jgi:hypothetical protein